MKPDEPKDDASVNVPDGWEVCEPKEGPGHLWTGARILAGEWGSEQCFWPDENPAYEWYRHGAIQVIGAVPVRRKRIEPLVHEVNTFVDDWATRNSEFYAWLSLLPKGTRIRRTFEVVEDGE